MLLDANDRGLKGDFGEAIATFQTVVDLSRAAADGSGEAAALAGMGNACRGAGDYPAAARNFEAAGKVFVSMGDSANSSLAYGDAGTTFFLLQDFNSHVRCWRSAMLSAKHSDDTDRMVR
jgi:tetratricopeptide (TPR) repeat protein